MLLGQGTLNVSMPYTAFPVSTRTMVTSFPAPETQSLNALHGLSCFHPLSIVEQVHALQKVSMPYTAFPVSTMDSR